MWIGPPHCTAGTPTPAPVSNRVMKQALAVSALLWITLPVGAAETSEWGQTVDGLRMSVAILSESGVDLQVRVTVNYLGRSPLLVPLGFATGDRISRYRPRLFVAAADGQHSFTLDDDRPLRGRFDPIVVPLVPQASYTLELPAADWHTVWSAGLSAMTPLPALLQQRVHLWVEWDCAYFQGTANPSCPLYGYPNPNVFPCWEGKLVSNRLRLAK
jgi:hypothetical protein